MSKHDTHGVRAPSAKSSASRPRELVKFVHESLAAMADERKAREMAAYMKTTMPFFGVQKPQRAPVSKEVNKRFAPGNASEYRAGVLALWARPEREMKYSAIGYACSFPEFIAPSSLPLYRRLILDGSWWDLVDDVAVRLVGRVLLEHRARVRPVMDTWIDHEHLWIRRAAIISHIGHREKTDERRLFDYCLRRADEKEFFIRKAIGWALRDYSYAKPGEVRAFLTRNRSRLSGLSYREGAKAMVRRGEMEMGENQA